MVISIVLTSMDGLYIVRCFKVVQCHNHSSNVSLLLLLLYVVEVVLLMEKWEGVEFEEGLTLTCKFYQILLGIPLYLKVHQSLLSVLERHRGGSFVNHLV